MNKIIISIMLSLGVALPVWAKNLYVNSSGTPACSDATTYSANSASSPWCTLGRATWGSTDRSVPVSAQAAQAGDTVIVSPGTYTGPQSRSKLDCTYSPINNGSAGSYITFSAEHSAATSPPGDRTVLETTGDGLQGDGGCVLGGASKAYHKWIGFFIDIDNAYVDNDTGPLVAWSSSYIEFAENYVTATTTPVSGTDDNMTGVRIENSTHITIRNNYIENMLSSNSHGAAVQGYNSRNVLIENNEIRTSDDGIYAKGEVNGNQTQLDWIVRYNLLIGNEHGILTGGVEGIDIYQNIVLDSVRAIRILSYTTPIIRPQDVTVRNNTVVDNTYGVFWSNDVTASGRNMTYRDNIFSANGGAVYFEGNIDKMYLSSGDIQFDGNYYQGNTSHGTVTWAAWTSTPYAQDAAGTQGSGTLFVDAQTDDYRLAADSPARTASTLAGPVGAYITGGEVIGITAGAAPIPAMGGRLSGSLSGGGVMR